MNRALTYIIFSWITCGWVYGDKGGLYNVPWWRRPSGKVTWLKSGWILVCRPTAATRWTDVDFFFYTLLAAEWPAEVLSMTANFKLSVTLITICAKGHTIHQKFHVKPSHSGHGTANRRLTGWKLCCNALWLSSNHLLHTQTQFNTTPRQQTHVVTTHNCIWFWLEVSQRVRLSVLLEFWFSPAWLRLEVWLCAEPAAFHWLLKLYWLLSF